MSTTATAGTSQLLDEHDTSTLVGEHAQLLRDVQRRAAPVLAALAGHRWPRAELHTLNEFLRASVLRQASDEETTLYPGGAQAPFAELTAEHFQLYALAEQLDRSQVKPCSNLELRDLTEHLLHVLEHHLVHEQEVLAALPDAPSDVPAAADLIAGTQDWPGPADGSVLIVLDALPQRHAVQICIERLLRLRPGQSADIHSSHDADIQQVCRWIHGFDSASYGIERPPSGQSPSPLRITRRHTT